jgi:predicted metalloprotease
LFAVSAVLVSVAAGPALAGVSGGSDGDEPTLEEDSGDTPAKQTKGYEKTIDLAVDDIQDFWAEEFPGLYGEEYEPIADDRIIAAEPGIKLPKCQGTTLTYDDAEDNAFYCYESNFIAYDDVSLFPQLFRDFGDFSIALVLAHEWGHAVQDRAENDDAPTIQKELQADCFAGAWVSSLDQGRGRLELANGNLDAGLAALLQFKDPIGTSFEVDDGAHGSGFDRISAFQEGFGNGAGECATYFTGPPPTIGDGVITEIPFTSKQDAASGGNLPADDVLPATVALITAFYSQVEPAYAGNELTIDDVYSYDSGGSERQLPECGGPLDVEIITNRVFYCIDDDYLGFDAPYVQHVYDDIGDFGVITLFANVYATYVQNLQGFPGVQENTDNAVLGADCYTGGFTSALFRDLLLVDPATGKPAYTLSPGDLDETVSAFIDYNNARGVESNLDAAFLRLDAFRGGFFNGYQSCASFATG